MTFVSTGSLPRPRRRAGRARRGLRAPPRRHARRGLARLPGARADARRAVRDLRRRHQRPHVRRRRRRPRVHDHERLQAVRVRARLRAARAGRAQARRSASTPPASPSTRSRPSSAARTGARTRWSTPARWRPRPDRGWDALHDGLERFAGRELAMRRGGLRLGVATNTRNRDLAPAAPTPAPTVRPSTTTRASARCWSPPTTSP